MCEDPVAPAPEVADPIDASDGSNGNVALDMVAKGLAESAQPAALLAQALQELPEVCFCTQLTIHWTLVSPSTPYFYVACSWLLLVLQQHEHSSQLG